MNRRIPGTARKPSFLRVIALLCLLLIVFSGCDAIRPSRPLPPEAQAPTFKAPALQPAEMEAELMVATSTASAAEEVECTNDLLYIEDLTIPDGNQLAAGLSIEKQWKVKNSGTCSWTGAYSIQLFSGVDLGAGSSQPLASASPGDELVISIYFTVPMEQGRYAGTWQAFDADGKPFGNWFSIEIISTGP